MAMQRVYKCPSCGEENDIAISGYEDGGGDYGDDLTPMFECFSCGHSFSGDEGFWGW